MKQSFTEISVKLYIQTAETDIKDQKVKSL